jgi:hypothetical protein
VQWFEDRESAIIMQRDAFQKLQAAIFAGQITTVVVQKLDSVLWKEFMEKRLCQQHTPQGRNRREDVREEQASRTPI